MFLDRDKDNSRRGTYCSYNLKKNNEYKQITSANTHAKQLRIKEVRSTRIQTHVLMRVKFPKSLFSHRQEVWSNISTSRWLSLRTRRPHNARACLIHHGAHFYPHIHHRRRARGEPAQLHGTPCVITQCPGPHRQPARANYGLALTRSSAESPPPPHHPHPHPLAMQVGRQGYGASTMRLVKKSQQSLHQAQLRYCCHHLFLRNASLGLIATQG